MQKNDMIEPRDDDAAATTNAETMEVDAAEETPESETVDAPSDDNTPDDNDAVDDDNVSEEDAVSDNDDAADDVSDEDVAPEAASDDEDTPTDERESVEGTEPVDETKSSDEGNTSDDNNAPAAANKSTQDNPDEETVSAPRRVLAALAPAGRVIRSIWRRRPKLPFTLYVLVFALVTAAAVLFMQWSVCTEPSYAPDAEVDETTRILDSVGGQLTQFVSQMWLEQDWRFLLNFLVLGFIYLTVILVLNRFWVSTAIFGVVMVVFAVANKFKMDARNEPIIPADLNFISGGNTGELMSFVPADGMPIMNTAVTGLTWFAVICILLQFLDRRNGLIPVRWRPSRFVSARNITAAAARVLAAILSVVLLSSFVWNLSIPHSWSNTLAANLSDAPEMWNGLGDARNNGPAMTFLRLVHTNVMDKPEDYNEETMRRIADHYADVADTINDSRSNDLTDSTVIMMLSESFSDPTRVPGVDFSQDPMPQLRALKDTTTSGLMVSPGYGGGTANIEFQALTGLSMALYDPTLSSAYQQLVPTMDDPATFNQLWDKDRTDGDGSVAFHPYNRTMYFRDRNYRSFGFDRFYAADGDDQMTGLTTIDSAWYASDESTYRNVLDYLSDNDDANKFIQVVTMQNHMPYDDWYQDNEFKDADTSTGLAENERVSVDTYAKGVSYTDQATVDFLHELDQMDRPITVVFYGDHLPGIYQSAAADPKNNVTLHETDYFIWSNAASRSADTKLPAETADITSSNFFMAELAAHQDAKVSPYLAFLTKLHDAIAAIAPASVGDGVHPACFDEQGQLIDYDALSDEDQSLLHDYQLIQYDMSVGHNYLGDTGFTDIASARSNDANHQ